LQNHKKYFTKENNNLSHRLVRDLAWVIASPPLVSENFLNTLWWDDENCHSEFEACLPALLDLDKDPTPLANHLSNQKSHRLGHRFEALVAYWFTISPNYKVLTQNHQIIIDGETKGELDFVIQHNKTKKIIHLEVAVKFYLGSDTLSDPYCWFGTNTKDQLGRKIDHLKNHQTQLSHLYKKHMPYIINESQCIIKGRLFYPENVSKSETPNFVSRNHLKGKWRFLNENKKETLIKIDKTDWLSVLTKSDCESYEILNEAALSKRPECYVYLGDDLAEKERIFYLPNGFRFPDGSIRSKN